MAKEFSGLCPCLVQMNRLHQPFQCHIESEWKVIIFFKPNIWFIPWKPSFCIWTALLVGDRPEGIKSCPVITAQISHPKSFHPVSSFLSPYLLLIPHLFYKMQKNLKTNMPSKIILTPQVSVSLNEITFHSLPHTWNPEAIRTFCLSPPTAIPSVTEFCP